MFRKILYPTDFSDCAVKVLEYVKKLKEDVSLIVLGSHAKSNVREMLLGSVSEKVIRDSKRHVLVVKRDQI
jgi:nucleotide-binding universal stress UspA family protein